MLTRRQITSPLLLLPLFKLVAHLATASGYGVFRDELYYLACARRLAWGYVDHPPFSIAILAAQRALFGESLFGIRVLAGLAGAATVLVVGLTARRLGGDLYAQALAMIATLSVPYGWAIHHFYSMNAWDMLAWALAGLLLADILSHDRKPAPRPLWIALGTVLGLGLLNKIGVLWLGAGLGLALLVTGERRRLRRAGPWLSASIALALFLPHLIWQQLHGWPTLEFIDNATSEKMVRLAPAQFLSSQLDIVGPLAMLVAVGGAIHLARSQRYRALAIAFAAVLAILVANGASRPGYLAPAYAWLFAAGGVAAGERLTAWPRLRWALPAVVLASGLALAPMALPVLPVETYVRYAAWLGSEPSTSEHKELAELPQFYADMHGWPSIVESVEGVWHTLSAEERRGAAIFTSNYGEAGAIEALATDPEMRSAVISGHNSYWLWGTRGRRANPLIAINVSEASIRHYYAEAELVGTTSCGRCMPYENDAPIWIGRQPRRQLADAWSEIRHFD